MTITMSRESRILRFYLWVWGADEQKISICKLFWGTILCFLAPMMREGKIANILSLTLMVGMYLFSTVILAAFIYSGLWLATIFCLMASIFFAWITTVILRDIRNEESEKAGNGRVFALHSKADLIIGGPIAVMIFGPGELIRVIRNRIPWKREGREKKSSDGWSMVLAFFSATKARVCPMIKIIKA